MTISPASGSDGRSSAFDRLADPVRRWIWDRGWQVLRDVQERAIGALIDEPRDTIIAAATAGGKTEAAFFPLISRLIDQRSEAPGFELLYVGPLRALINDQFARLEDLCERAEIQVTPWHGDISAGIKARARKNPRGVLLITPESLEALFVLRGLEVPGLFRSLDAVVIDELHALLDTERGVHLRSLLSRLELATGRRIPRVGLSATLGDMNLARVYLRPDEPESVELIEGKGEENTLRVQVRGYSVARAETPQARDAAREASERAIAGHLHEKLRGGKHLVFAGSRQRVEIFADRLRRLCEEARMPNEFLPHHANLSREHRTDLEKRLKNGTLPTTAVCTSTLELGVDIGHVECVGQIGAPHSVAALRQRLGRSGRRPGQPMVLRMYVQEIEDDPGRPLTDRLRLELVRGIACVELLRERWCEPPRTSALHLSTLVHQILSIIAERGGASASRLFATLCVRGPFGSVDQSLFADVLRAIGHADVALIEQGEDGSLLLGRVGERIVGHHSFYAVFQTPEEYRVLHKGKSLGTLPITTPLAPGLTIIFSGRRWKIEAVHSDERSIEVERDPTGKAPLFGGEMGPLHDVVAERMRTILASDGDVVYLDQEAQRLLEEARATFRRLRLDQETIVSDAGGTLTMLTWKGTVSTLRAALAIRAEGFSAEPRDAMVVLGANNADRTALEAVCRSLDGLVDPDPHDLAEHLEPLAMEKFHPFLTRELLVDDAASRLR